METNIDMDQAEIRRMVDTSVEGLKYMRDNFQF